MDSKKKKTIFCSYAHEDHQFLQELNQHLSPLLRQYQDLLIWTDTNISPGSEWEREIQTHLDNAKIILLLISPAFMASRYCYSIEMMRAMQRHDQREAHVIPIIIRPVYWQNAPFGSLQVLPKEGRPVEDRNWYTRDEAFLDVTKGIQEVIENFVIAPMYSDSPIQSQTSVPSTLPSTLGPVTELEEHISSPPAHQSPTLEKVRVEPLETFTEPLDRVLPYASTKLVGPLVPVTSPAPNVIEETSPGPQNTTSDPNDARRRKPIPWPAITKAAISIILYSAAILLLLFNTFLLSNILYPIIFLKKMLRQHPIILLITAGLVVIIILGAIISDLITILSKKLRSQPSPVRSNCP